MSVTLRCIVSLPSCSQVFKFYTVGHRFFPSNLFKMSFPASVSLQFQMSCSLSPGELLYTYLVEHLFEDGKETGSLQFRVRLMDCMPYVDESDEKHLRQSQKAWLHYFICFPL